MSVRLSPWNNSAPTREGVWWGGCSPMGSWRQMSIFMPWLHFPPATPSRYSVFGQLGWLQIPYASFGKEKKFVLEISLRSLKFYKPFLWNEYELIIRQHVNANFAIASVCVSVCVSVSVCVCECVSVWVCVFFYLQHAQLQINTTCCALLKL